MAIRFRRSIKIAPGIRINIGKSGASVSMGPRGASISIGKRGAYGNVGLPGTGISLRENLFSGSKSSNRAHHDTVKSYSDNSKLVVNASLDETGVVTFLDESEQEIAPELVRSLKHQQKDQIMTWLQDQTDRINNELASLLNIHIDTPSPTKKIDYIVIPFEEAKPQPVKLKSLGILGRLFKSRKEKIHSENIAAQQVYEEQLKKWQNNKVSFEKQQAHEKLITEKLRLENTSGMSEFLELRFALIKWQRETLVNFEVASLNKVYIDVDLPEIEDIPNKIATAAKRDIKVNLKNVSDAQQRRNYSRHVHGVGFRIIGECFAALPTVDTVVLSAYSQRIDSATGSVADQYLFSVAVNREAWKNINFSGLEQVDPVEALSTFELKRKMTKTGIFTPIEPFSPPQSIAP